MYLYSNKENNLVGKIYYEINFIAYSSFFLNLKSAWERFNGDHISQCTSVFVWEKKK